MYSTYTNSRGIVIFKRKRYQRCDLLDEKLNHYHFPKHPHTVIAKIEKLILCKCIETVNCT